MANLIDNTYFKGEYLIPGLSGTNPVAATKLEKLTAIITRREPEILKVLLGTDLYAEFIAGLAVLPTPDAKWTNLKVQLVNTSLKTSVYTGMMYYYFAESMERANVAAGNDNNIAPAVNHFQLADLWNLDSDLQQEVIDWITDPVRSADYTSFSGTLPGYMNPIW